MNRDAFVVRVRKNSEWRTRPHSFRGDVLEPPLRGMRVKPENGREPETERAADVYKQIGWETTKGDIMPEGKTCETIAELKGPSRADRRGSDASSRQDVRRP